MNNAEVAAEIRRWVKEGPHDAFSWPTDGCGYGHHIRFVKHRSENYKGRNRLSFLQFCLDYADELSP